MSKLVRFLIAFSIIVINIGIICLFHFEIVDISEDYITIFSTGLFSLLGQILFFICYDLLSNKNGFGRVIKFLLLIIAWALITLSFVLLVLIFFADIRSYLNPWQGAALAQWLMCGLFSYRMYKIVEEGNKKFVSPFIPYMSLCCCYFINIPILYLLALVAKYVEFTFIIICLYLVFLIIYSLIMFKIPIGESIAIMLNNSIEGISNSSKNKKFNDDYAENKVEKPKYDDYEFRSTFKRRLEYFLSSMDEKVDFNVSVHDSNIILKWQIVPKVQLYLVDKRLSIYVENGVMCIHKSSKLSLKGELFKHFFRDEVKKYVDDYMAKEGYKIDIDKYSIDSSVEVCEYTID